MQNGKTGQEGNEGCNGVLTFIIRLWANDGNESVGGLPEYAGGDTTRRGK
jgi:hypothetical protein